MSRLTEGLILLLATAVVSGLLVPFVVNRIQLTNQERLKTYEVNLARQSKIVDEQAAFLHRISSLLWEFQLALIAPLYYGQSSLRRPQRTISTEVSTPAEKSGEDGPYEISAKTYLTNASRLLGSVRAEIGGAVRLVPIKQSDKLRRLYYDELLRLDLQVTQCLVEGPTPSNSASWGSTLTYLVNDFALVLDATIDGLAESVDLKYEKVV